MKSKWMAVLFLGVLSTQPVLAAKRSSDSVRTSPDPKANVNFSDVHFGLGVTTFAAGATGSGVSFGLDIGETVNLQVVTAVTATTGGLGGGATVISGPVFRYSLIGDRKLGFHLGAGVTLGTNGSNFLINMMPLVGFHWMFLDHLAVHVDLGPNFQIVASSPVGFNFNLGSVGNPLGLSVHYYF